MATAGAVCSAAPPFVPVLMLEQPIAKLLDVRRVDVRGEHLRHLREVRHRAALGEVVDHHARLAGLRVTIANGQEATILMFLNMVLRSWRDRGAGRPSGHAM